jgi:septum formation protein
MCAEGYDEAAENTLLYLASASPRRGELLRQIGIAHATVSVDVDETTLHAEAAEDYVLRVALAKAQAGWALVRQRRAMPVLGADTCVVLDSEILGKPRGEAHAIGMLTRLGGRTHRVLTAVALVDGESQRVAVSESRVRFREVRHAEALAYWRTGEPRDKAGGYAIQGLGAVFVAHLEGSYSGVMGLPLFEVAQLLDDAGMRRLR